MQVFLAIWLGILELLKQPIPVVTLLTTGDILLARTINAKSAADGDFSWPFAASRHILKSADLTFVNLETPLLANCPVLTTGFKFCGASPNALALAQTGVDIANLANNHATNYGSIGLNETISHLALAGVKVTGVQDPLSITKNGIAFAFLGFDDTLSPIRADQFVQSIREAKAGADHVIVAIHWGTEYTDQPTSRQSTLGHLAIDSGASLVIGNHPHWIQPIEKYRAGYIYYSHGNFIFDQFWSESTRRGLIIQTLLSKDSILNVNPRSIYIDRPGVPRLVPLEGIEPPTYSSEARRSIR